MSQKVKERQWTFNTSGVQLSSHGFHRRRRWRCHRDLPVLHDSSAASPVCFSVLHLVKSHSNHLFSERLQRSLHDADAVYSQNPKNAVFAEWQESLLFYRGDCCRGVNPPPLPDIYLSRSLTVPHTSKLTLTVQQNGSKSELSSHPVLIQIPERCSWISPSDR